MQKQARNRILARSGVPPLFRDANLLDFDFEIDCKKSYYIHGPAGTGKTHLAAAILAAVKANHRTTPARFITAANLLTEILACFNTNDTMTEKQIIQLYTEKTDLLVLDDLGAQKPTEWVVMTLQNIIDIRYSNLMQTVVTSNLNLPTMMERFDARLARRLDAMGEVLELT